MQDHAELELGPAPERSRAECAVSLESRRPPCPVCTTPMEPEHAHHKCPGCGYIEPCCGW